MTPQTLGLLEVHRAINDLKRHQKAFAPKEFSHGGAGRIEREPYDAVRDSYNLAYQQRGWKTCIESEMPLQCDEVADFKGRLLAALQPPNYQKWTPSQLAYMAEHKPESFQAAESIILARSDAFTRRKGAPLQPIITKDRTGREITEFTGDKASWMNAYKGPG